jgi:hypothetical protein
MSLMSLVLVVLSVTLLHAAVACYVCDKSYALIGGLQDFPIGLTGAVCIVVQCHVSGLTLRDWPCVFSGLLGP